MKKILLALLLFATTAKAEVLVGPNDTMITQWQSGHGYTKQSAGGTGTDDTSVYLFGTQSFRIDTPNDNVTVTFRKSSISPTFDMTGKYLKLFIRIEDTSKISQMAIWLSSNNMSASYFWNLHGDLTYYENNTWEVITLPWAGVSTSGSPTKNAINSIQFTIKDTGAGAAKVWLGGLYYVPEPSSGIVVIDADDGWDTQYSKMAPKLASYGYSATGYLIPELIGTANYITLAQALELKNTYGWEFGIHGIDSWSSLTSEQLLDHVQDVKDYLSTNNLANGSPYWLSSYPNGAYNHSVISDLQASDVAMSRTIIRHYYESLPPAHMHKLRQVHFNHTTPVATITGYIDAAMTAKALAIVTFHTIATPATVGTQITEADFNAIIDHIHTQGYTVKKMSEVVAMYPEYKVIGTTKAYGSAVASQSMTSGTYLPNKTTGSDGTWTQYGVQPNSSYSYTSTLSGYTCGTTTGTITADTTVTVPCTTDWSGISAFATARGTLVSATSTTAKLASGEKFPDGYFKDKASLCIVSGVGAGQCRTIVGYVSYTQTVTVSPAWNTTPDSTSGYTIDLVGGKHEVIQYRN